jgi:hypothetical protein
MPREGTPFVGGQRALAGREGILGEYRRVSVGETATVLGDDRMDEHRVPTRQGSSARRGFLPSTAATGRGLDGGDPEWAA